MSDLLDEIREDLSREKYALIWQKFGNYIIGAAIAALILTSTGVAAKKFINYLHASYSDALFEANNAPNAEALVKYDELMKNGNATYKAIAGLRKAALLLQSSKNTDALAVYKKVIDESGGPQELTDLAKLLYIAVSSNIAADNKDYNNADAKKYLEENIGRDSVFKYSTMEINAFKEIESHNYTKAKDIFNQLLESPDAPSNIKARAKEMIDAILNMNDLETKNGQQ